MRTGGVIKALLVLAGVAALNSVASASLLTNGGFNTDVDGSWGPDGWTSWSWANPGSGGFADYKTSPTDQFTKDGSPYINAGSWGQWWQGGGGWYQIVPATAGLTYTLSVDCATESWSATSGEMRLIFQDAASQTIGGNVVLHTADEVASQPWTPFSLTTTAPAGTVAVKVEFATWGVPGTVLWDNAVLSVPEPVTLGLVGCGATLLLGRRRAM